MQNTKEKSTLDAIWQWINSGKLKNIVDTFGGVMPDTDEIRKKAKWLLKFSECWDYRRMQKEAHDSKTGENARWKIAGDEITESQKKAVLDGIYELGLVGVEEPTEKEFDYVIALGGARFSCLYRSKYAAELIEKRGVQSKAVVMLSGMRPVADSEREATDTYAPEAKTEFDLMNAGAEKVFGLRKNYIEECYHNENSNKGWAVRKYDFNGEMPVFSVSGPSSEPEKRRANSADTYQFFLKRFQVKKGTKILLVTSQIYVPYQQMEAIRTLAEPNGLYIETVGFPTEWSGKLQGMMEPANYLQEIRSTIQAINRYLEHE